MKIVLAALGFKNRDVAYNKNIIINTLKKYCKQADMVVFGESFLQGFYSIVFNYEEDQKVALPMESNIIKEIKDCSKKYGIAVSFGYFELFEKSIYSSQITIDKNGNIINNYRRISSGWKEVNSGPEYKEGKNFNSFVFENRTFSVALCGDLWDEDNIKKMNEIKSNFVLWPVYTDFNFIEWNKKEKYEYATQAGKLERPVLYVNSYNLDMNEDDSAKGGACLFSKCLINNEIPSGKEDVLIVEI